MTAKIAKAIPALFVISFVLLGTAFAAQYAFGAASYQFVYTVQSGDTLYSISQKFQVAKQSIETANNMHRPYKVYSGEVLIVPLSSPSVTYSVQSGDSLYSIGRSFEVAWQNIALANNIVSPYTIYPGEQLVIPLVSGTILATTSSSSTTTMQSSTSTTSSSSIVTSSTSTPTSSTSASSSTTSTVCVYQSFGGADGSGWWCWTVSTSQLTSSGLTPDLQGTATYFGVCLATLEQDNGYNSNVAVTTGEILAIPNGAGCPVTTSDPSSPSVSTAKQAWVWLWENYDSGLSAIQQHPGALTVVSPNTYTLTSSGTFAIQSTQAEICPQVHSLGLECDPLIQNDQTNPTGLNTLLTSPTLQSEFINAAVSEAQSSGLDGYNVDFEPSSGVLNLASQYATFLTNFANAMHAVGKQISVDVASWDGGALWNYSLIGATPVDLVLTMDTYASNYTTFTQGLNNIIASVPLGKVAVGLLTVTDDSTLQQRMQAIESSGVSTVMVWPSYPGFLTNIYWGNLTQFLQS